MTPTGMLFDVKRFAVHDGPGVRTVLFLKGCPLRCRWCHNPEGMEARPQLAYYGHKCLHCGECVKACLRNAHSLVDGRHLFDHAKCVACGACEEVCPGRALKLFGRTMTGEEACRLALEDKAFYKDGGGVTLSGGEPLLQPDFCVELLKLLKGQGVHCAIDTSGAVKWESFEKVLPHSDLFLYDVKHVDNVSHRGHVGSSNDAILNNLKRLSRQGVPIEIRIPAIPGFNLDGRGIASICQFLSALKNIAGVRLLPYHPVRSKHEALGYSDAMADVEPPSAQDIERATLLVKSFGLEIR